MAKALQDVHQALQVQVVFDFEVLDMLSVSQKFMVALLRCDEVSRESRIFEKHSLQCVVNGGLLKRAWEVDPPQKKQRR